MDFIAQNLLYIILAVTALFISACVAQDMIAGNLIQGPLTIPFRHKK